MPFYPPSWVPKLPFDPPDSISIEEFMWSDKYGRYSLDAAQNPFTCGLSGKTYTTRQVKQRVESLARGLAKELGWQPNVGTEWDKVIGVFSLNAIDTLTLAWATHRIGGVQTPANAAYSAEELAYQLKDSGAKCLFTCLPLLATSLAAAEKVGIPKNRIYILEIAKEATGGKSAPAEFKTVDDLIKLGADLPGLEPLKWSNGEGARRTAFICYSSGTSGLPKGVMISHRNVIANVLQTHNSEREARNQFKKPGQELEFTENILGLLPFSHIYGLVVITHLQVYRGDGVIVLPKFEFQSFLESIQNYKIGTLYLVPPIIIVMTKNQQVLKKFDLSSIRDVFSGAAPLGKETAEDFTKAFPGVFLRQGYGLTETSTVVCSTSINDVWFGSSGSLISDVVIKLVSPDGVEITAYDTPGELVVKSPSVTLGYLHNDKATKETFEDGWMKTGDEAVVSLSPNGFEHVIIVDRIKELIKVKAHQVAPAELEALLLSHPAVDDCAVIPVPDEAAGEVPKAFVVKSKSIGIEESDKFVAKSIENFVKKEKAHYKWLKGGVEFIDEIPKSPSGKILRRFLRDREKEKRRKEGAKL